MPKRLLLITLLLVAAFGRALAQSVPTDLDALMFRVLDRRDDNWKKLQQYVLEERETFQVTGPGAIPIYGIRRESAWFPRDGMFIKSPLRVNGVTIGEDARRTAEEQWIKREAQREARRTERASRETVTTDTATAPISEDSVREAIEPGFVSAAYFLKFKFDPGQYALAGRETIEGRAALKIEYYPTKLFSEGRTRPNKDVRKRDEDVERKMNKVALVTLWVDPAEQQILKYEFRNMDLDFLPGRSLVRVDGMTASMEMGQPFPAVWLPRAIRVGLDLTLAAGHVDGRYAVDYHDYKLATVTTRVR